MWNIVNGNNVDILRTYPDNTFDSIVTDPPYGIDFLGKSWDANTGALETYLECLRVLKPGGHILAFSAARTYHHLAVTIEQAGFEIRDQIMWIYSSGFPKSQDVGKSIDRAAGKKDPNYGSKKTAKQGAETVADFATGVRCGKCDRTFNPDIIRACEQDPCGMRYQYQTAEGKAWAGWGTALKPAHEPICLARKPMKKLSTAKNCQQWGVGALNIDATRVPIEGPDTRSGGTDGWSRAEFGQAEPDKYDGTGYEPNDLGRFPSNVIGEITGYQRYYYCPKVSKGERGEGNNHPTVKPIDLMKYLIKLVTPPGGHVLDPFNGSGSTGCAAVALNMNYTGIELDPGYCAIAQRRIAAWEQQTKSGTTFEDLFE